MSGASILFLLNRYLLIAVVVIASLMAFNNGLAQQVRVIDFLLGCCSFTHGRCAIDGCTFKARGHW